MHFGAVRRMKGELAARATVLTTLRHADIDTTLQNR